MNLAALTNDQHDALQELTNIAMGQAGASLATLLDEFVNLSVPRIRIVAVIDLPPVLAELVGKNNLVSAARQSFQGYLRGEAIIIFGEPGCQALADLMGFEGELGEHGETELLLDVANVLSGACLGGMMEQIRKFTETTGSTELGFSMPSIMARQVMAAQLIDPGKVQWSHALLLEVNFTIQNRNFIAHLTMLMPEDGIEKIRGIIDEFIAAF
jgi:chemotaxis protein CheC